MMVDSVMELSELGAHFRELRVVRARLIYFSRTICEFRLLYRPRFRTLSLIWLVGLVSYESEAKLYHWIESNVDSIYFLLKDIFWRQYIN